MDLNERCLVVPGNHDVQDLEEAYDYSRTLPDGLPDGHAQKEGRGYLIRNATEHRKRLKPFSELFYQPLFGEPYPLEPAAQGMVRTFADLGLQFLLLNSAWELDEFDRGNANIDPAALAAALKQANEELADAGGDLQRIGVWHHALETEAGGDRLKNPGILKQHLQKNGFKLGLHGDVHKLERQWIGYWHVPSSLHIVGSGSFGSPDVGIEHATPRLYNLLLFKKDRSTVQVHTRAQPKEGGAWEGWAHWPSREDSESEARYPYFEIPLA